MKITDKDIDKLDELSRLELSVKEKTVLTKDLASILDFVGQLQKVDVAAVKIDLAAVPANSREDKITECLPSARELILKNVPDKTGDLIEVKPVF